MVDSSIRGRDTSRDLPALARDSQRLLTYTRAKLSMSESSRASPHTLTELRKASVKLPSLVIRAIAANGELSEMPLGVEALVVGSSPECDLVIADPRVSRRHCELSLREE